MVSRVGFARTRSALVLLVAAAVGFGGCVYPMPSKTTHRYFDRDDISFIERGKTTRAEIRERLGDPGLMVSNPERWVFPLRRFDANRWGMCIAIPAGFGGVGDCGQISDGKSKVEYLYLRFDASGKVRDIRTPAVLGTECIEPGVCPGSLLLVRDDVTRTIPAGFYANLERRDGLYYERDSEVPFTGRRELRHPDGSPAGHLEFENGLENGYHCEWYETGQAKLVAHYENGHKEGLERGWHDNGTMSYRVNYANGLIDGMATAWKSDGTVVLEACFENDVLVGVSSEACAN